MTPYRRSWRCKDMRAPPRPCRKCVAVPPSVHQQTAAVQHDSTASKSEVIKKVFLMGN